MKRYLITILGLVSFQAISSEPPREIAPIPVDSAAATLIAEKVTILKDLNQAHIAKPKFVFDKDFGMGPVAIPFITWYESHANLSDWICEKFGFGRALSAYDEQHVSAAIFYHESDLRERRLLPRDQRNNTFIFKDGFTNVQRSLSCELK